MWKKICVEFNKSCTVLIFVCFQIKTCIYDRFLSMESWTAGQYIDLYHIQINLIPLVKCLFGDSRLSLEQDIIIVDASPPLH